jgi:phage terminase large subunit-like protein
LTVTRGNTIDEDAIVEAVLESGSRHKCLEVAYDRWNASHVVRRLTDEGLTMVPIGQGFASLSFPSKELEKRVVAAELNHMGNPILDWMAQNCATETDAAANIKPSKVKSTEKIDGIVGLVMSLARYVAHSGAKRSKYEDKGVTQFG